MDIKRRTFLGGLATAGGATLLPLTGAVPEAQAQDLPYPRPDLTTRKLPRRFKYNKPVIDAHTHIYAREFIDLVVKEGADNGAEVTGPDRNGDYRIRAMGGGHGAGYYPYGGSTFNKSLSDVDFQLKGMEERDVDMHAVGMTHPKIYWAPPQFAHRLAQAQNNGISAIHVKYPKKFVGQIMLPLQDMVLSMQELERASKLPGMRGINMAQHINGVNISDQRFWPLWARCAALGHPLVLHNLDPLGAERLYQGGIDMMNNLGNPFEATVASMSLILSGCLDEIPNLEVYLPHAGGALPWLVWRTDYTMQRGEGFKRVKSRKASDYLRRFHYDLILHSPKYMRTLIDMVGADRVTCGTDWPQGMAVWRPVEYVESIPGITQREAELILCENPARLLRVAT